MVGRCLARFAAVLVIAFAAIAVPQLPRAATAFSYSTPDGTYGWCVRDAPADAGRCADDYCRSAGGAACATVITCADGDSAVAKPDPPLKGVAITCGLAGSGWARMIAIANCAAAVNDLCWTDTVTDRNGNEHAADEVQAFDRAFYAQFMLQARSYAVDAVNGDDSPQTTLAIGAFQRAVGLTETGTTDPPLLFYLIAAVAGRQAVVDDMKHSLADAYAPSVGRNVFVQATEALPRRSYAHELSAMTPEDRKAAMVTTLRASGTSCQDPVSDVFLPDAESSMFTVTCADLESVVILMDDGGRMVSSTPRAAAKAVPQP